MALSDRTSSADDAASHQVDRRDCTKTSTDHVIHSTSKPPPARDVTDDVSGNLVNDWLEQLVYMSSMLSRFITLEYFSDGAALTKALWFGCVYFPLRTTSVKIFHVTKQI